MKRIYLVLFSLLTLATASFAADHYYYENGQRINLTVVNDYVLVKPVAGFDDWVALLDDKPYLDSEFAPFSMADGFMLLRLTQGYSAEAAVSDLTNTTDIDLANNVYSYPQGGVHLRHRSTLLAFSEHSTNFTNRLPLHRERTCADRQPLR